MAKAIEEMRDLLRTSVEVVADSVHFGNLWVGIESRIDAAQARAFSPLELQAFADGELSAEAAVALATKTAMKSDSRDRIASLSEMGGLLRQHVADVADSTDFSTLWPRIEAKVDEQLAQAELKKNQSETASPQVGWFGRFITAIGGYRTVLASAATAAIAVAVMLPFALRDEAPDNIATDINPTIEIHHVVHVEDWQANPGYEVVIDDQHNGNAPVIYIRPDEAFQSNDSNDASDPNGLFDNPI